MKKLGIVLTTALTFAFVAILVIWPIKDTQSFNYTVRVYTLKAAYENVPCPTTGLPVESLIYMDVSEIGGPCDCPSYYNYEGTMTTHLSGRFCP